MVGSGRDCPEPARVGSNPAEATNEREGASRRLVEGRRMKLLLQSAALVAFSTGLAAAVLADESPAAMPDGAVGATFHYTTSVKTPKSTTSGSGQITIAKGSSGGPAMTISTSDGTTKTVPLKVENGTIAPAASPRSSMPPAAAAMLANMKLAATVGVAAKKSGGQNFSVQISLAPLGKGAPIPLDLSMAAKAASGNVTYSGTAAGSTTTVLPQSGGADSADLAKDAGAGVATQGFTPAGRIATAVAMHHRQEQQKQTEQNGVPDDVSVTVTTTFAAGHFQGIQGAQTDTLHVAARPVKIYSTWSFTRVSH